MRPCVSVLMPCFNPGPFLHDAVASVLAQPECLELVVADGGSTDGTLAALADWAAADPRVRVSSEPDPGPADALNKAFQRARGTLIGWLNADDLYTPGALQRACAALAAHPQWLLVYGEGEEFAADGSSHRYPTCRPEVGLAGFRSHCFICQPTVVFRRTCGLLLGPFDCRWRTAFDFDYWLRAFNSFPHRIGHIPHLQARTRLHPATITSSQRAQVSLEAIALIARQFGVAPIERLHHYGLELQRGIAQLPDGLGMEEHLQQMAEAAAPCLDAQDLAEFRHTWGLPPARPLPSAIGAPQ